MKRRWHHGLMIELRKEARLFARLCLLVLMLPLLHPIAEARAAENGTAFIICTEFGSPRATMAGKADLPIGAPDDCPCGIVCAMHGFAPLAAQAALALHRLEPGTSAIAPIGPGAPGAPPDLYDLRPPGRAPPLFV